MDLATRTRLRLRIVVGALICLTVIGMAVLWPRADDLPARAEPPPPFVDGTVQEIERYETAPDMITGSRESAIITVEVTSGPDRGRTITIDQQLEGLPPIETGARVRLFPAGGLDDAATDYYIGDFQRGGALWLLLAVFVGMVLAVSRWYGARALLGLAISLLIIVQFVVPAILAGRNPSMVALVGALAVMLVTLYLAHGVSIQTTSAVVGTAIALGATILLGTWFIDRAALTGFASDEAAFARFAVETLDLRGLVLAGLIIAALGVLDDVTVSQASTVFTLHDTDPTLSLRQVVSSAMRVGRDHIAATVNTLFLAYAGASLALLILFSTSGQPLEEILTSEVVAEELVKTLVGSLGLILAVPTTTVLAATVATRRSREEIALSRSRHRLDHVH
jgi:uncharacterized membrane protein